MKLIYKALYFFIKAIASLIFLAGLCFAALGIFVFFHTIYFSPNDKYAPAEAGILLLKTIDMFLIAIVAFIFSLGLMVLFDNKKELTQILNLPDWLQVKNFMQLKVILWEAILTTMVITFLVNLAESRFKGIPLDYNTLIIPAAIFIISISLYALKKSENH